MTSTRALFIGLLSFSAISASSAVSSAALDPELKSPYQIRLVLSVAEHRMLTPQFHKQLESDLRDQLQLAFGKLAQVEVVRAHPLLGGIRNKGLQATLDAWDELSDSRTVFVLVDFADGEYRVQTGQHDGMTGLSNPVVRRAAVAVPQRVADTAARLILDDFGVVGTFQSVEGAEVKLAIKGGQLADSLAPWIKVGDAFAIVRITKEGAALRAAPVEWAILQAVAPPEGGHVRCRYAYRYSGDQLLTDRPPIAGYRCIKLPTKTAPLRLRLVNQNTGDFLNLKVQVSTNPDFKGELVEGAAVQGLFDPKVAFTNVAYVKISSGGADLTGAIPVPLVDDRTVVLRMVDNPKAIQQGEVESQKQHWLRRYVEALALAEHRLSQFNDVLTPKTLERALKLGRESLEAMAADMNSLATMRGDIEKRAAEIRMDPPPDLSDGQRMADALARRHDQLKKHLVAVEKALKSSDETRELEATLQRAVGLEKQADFEQAIQLYDLVQKKRPDAIGTHLKDLRTAWQIKNKQHAEARQFIYETWPALDLPGVKANIGKAREMLKRCQAEGDYKTPLKLVLVNVNHAAVLTKRLEVLRKAPDSDDHRTELKALLQLGGELRALEMEAAAWVAKDPMAAK